MRSPYKSAKKINKSNGKQQLTLPPFSDITKCLSAELSMSHYQTMTWSSRSRITPRQYLTVPFACTGINMSATYYLDNVKLSKHPITNKKET